MARTNYESLEREPIDGDPWHPDALDLWWDEDIDPDD